MPSSTIRSITPSRVVVGGRLVLHGDGFSPEDGPRVRIADQPAPVLFASSRRVIVAVPAQVEGGLVSVTVDDEPAGAEVEVGSIWATGLHQVDNPVFNNAGELFVTYSGSRGQEAPISIFRVTRDGTREPFASGIVNATSLAFGPDGDLYVSSRFEGTVYRVRPDGTHQVAATDLGVACGIAFDTMGTMYVGDRTGTVFRVRDGHATAFATLAPSVAAFHLAMSPDGELFVCAPTLGSYDYVYRINRNGEIRTVPTALGRPQGVAFSPDGVLHVVDALAGASAVYRFPDLDGPPELVVSGPSLVGVAFGPDGELAVTSNDTAYRFA